MWCLDDRRKKVRVEQDIDVDTNKTLRRAMLRRQRVLYYVGFLVLLMIATICFLPVRMLLAHLLPTSQIAVTLLTGLVCATLLAVMLLYWQWWVFIRCGGGRLRKAGVCLCCLYDMTKSPVEEDGCTICPECGAAWKVGGADGRAEGIV